MDGYLIATVETAESLGVSEDVVKTRLSRARAALRQALLDRTGTATSEAFRFYRPGCDRAVATVLAYLRADAARALTAPQFDLSAIGKRKPLMYAARYAWPETPIL